MQVFGWPVEGFVLLAAWSILGWHIIGWLTYRRWRNGILDGDLDEAIQRNLIAVLPALLQEAMGQAKQAALGTIGGLVSGEAREEKGLDRAMATDLLMSADPFAAELLKEHFPGVYRYITKHPAQTQRALELIGPYLQQAAAKAGTQTTFAAPTNGSAHSTKW